MPDLEHARPSTIRNAAWRTAYRIGFPLARIWWRVRRQRHEGALVAVHVGPALLLVRSSYRIAWNFPGGTIRRGETPEMAARRELAEEIGLTGYRLLPAGTACGIWDGRIAADVDSVVSLMICTGHAATSHRPFESTPRPETRSGRGLIN
jgi:8-oxo-dGTP diphosphatase